MPPIDVAGESARWVAAAMGGAAARSWLFFACLEPFSLGALAFLFGGGASVLASPFGVEAAFRPGVGAGLATSLSLAGVSNENVGAAALRGRPRLSPPSVS